MKSFFTVVFLFFLSLAPSLAQEHQFMVFFSNKRGSAYSLERPAEFLSARALSRREAQGIALSEQDLPVNPAYVQALRRLGIETRFATKWLNGVLVKADSARLPALLALGAVERVEYVAPLTGTHVFRRSPAAAPRKALALSAAAPMTQAATDVQNRVIGVDYLRQEGCKGRGKWVGVFDAGFDGVDASRFFRHLFADGRVEATRDFIGSSGNVYQYDAHGTEVLSTMAAYAEGEYEGTATEATYVLCVTENATYDALAGHDFEYRLEEYNWLFAAEFADSLGVDVVNSSLGYYAFNDPSMDYSHADLYQNTAVISQAAKILASKGVVVVNSAGNEGAYSWRYTGFPADTPEVLTVGAIDQDSVLSSFSSLGFEAPGAPVKPDVVAVGRNAQVIGANGRKTTNNGTSFSSHMVAGMVASLWSAFPEYTAQELVQAVRESSSQFAQPDNRLGYGVPNPKRLFGFLPVKPESEGLVVFPNPVRNRVLNLRWNAALGKRRWSLQMYDLFGHLVHAETGQKASGQKVNTLFLPQKMGLGKYLIRIRTENNAYSAKIILE